MQASLINRWAKCLVFRYLAVFETSRLSSDIRGVGLPVGVVWRVVAVDINSVLLFVDVATKINTTLHSLAIGGYYDSPTKV